MRIFIKNYLYVYIILFIKMCAYNIKKCLLTSYFSIGDVIMMKFDDKAYLAKTIKIHRKKLNLTQAELAERVDLSDQHISRIESGCYTPSLKSFFQIVSVLSIDLREFGFNTDLTNNPTKDSLISRIAQATDAELIFYENSINAINKSLTTLKKNLL